MLFNSLGRGMEYPLICSNGAAKVVTGDTLLNQAILQLLNTELGSLPATPTFGSRLNIILFEPIDTLAINLGTTYIREAMRQEGRVNVLSIKGTIDPTNNARVLFALTYQERASGDIVSLIYPFDRQI